jgi:DNA-binding LytR/AlgR family response regulator
MKVVIIEDEPQAQKELKRLLGNSSFKIEVLECLDSVEDAVEWLATNEAPDLMFFDIQLSDGLSFEIFEHIEVKSPIIFTTAFDEYAIKAFKVNSVDYLLKPVKQSELNAALFKFDAINQKMKRSGGLQMDQIQELLQLHKPRFKNRFLCRIGDQITYVNTEDIAYFKAEDNEVLLITNSGQKYFINHSLDQLNNYLNPDYFYRINRAYFVHLSAIKKISKYFNSRLLLYLSPETEGEVLISRAKVTDFLNWIDK